MSLFDKFRKDGKPQHPIPDDSTVMGSNGIYDARVFVRSLAYDALLGEAGEEILSTSYELPPVSEEGRESLQRDSEQRLEKIIAALPIIESATDTVIRIVAELNPKAKEMDPGLKERAISYEKDVARRCVLATLTTLVDLGLIESYLPEAKLHLITFGDDDDE